MENDIRSCGRCPFFITGAVTHFTRCDLTHEITPAHESCHIHEDIMDNDMARTVLQIHNKWRRGGDGPQVPAHLLGVAIDYAISKL